MAITRLDNIRTDVLRWAFQRAGFHEEEAVSVFPALEGWLSGEKAPTVSQLENFAAKFHVPFGYLFLQQVPEEKLPFPRFRGKAGRFERFDLNVYDTVMSVRGRQDWLEDYLVENGIDVCRLVKTVRLDMPVGEAVARLRQELRLEPRWAFSLASVDVAVGVLTQQLEDAGVFLAYNGVVGNNTHRKLSVESCRGFAMVSDVAPYIFVNSTDSKTAQMFTLIHETAHLMLGVSAGHAGEEVVSDDRVEVYCDRVAAEFLVPAIVLREVWNGNIKYAAHRFKVSELVIARRAHDLKLLTDEEYRAFWQKYSQRPVMKREGGGGDFYLTSVKRVGRLFAIHVRNAVNSRQLDYTEAYRLTGLYGKTYEHFMANNI